MNGLLLINKPSDWTSFDAVNFARKKLKVKKVGHTGTLDPFATGLLILCLGQATKIAKIFLEMPKTYTATFTFGRSTDTDDLTGTTLQTTTRIPEKEAIEEAIQSHFTGAISQLPPQYSALKIDGQRAYALARQGEKVELKTRPVTIFDYQILDYAPPALKVSVTVSSGTYIRSLARDLGTVLSSLAHVSALCRTAIGSFSLTDAHELKTFTPQEIIPLDEAINFLPSHTLKKDCLSLVQNGHPLKDSFFTEPETLKNLVGYSLLREPSGKLLSILENQTYIIPHYQP